MTTEAKPTVTKDRDTERAELLTRIYETLVGMGAQVKVVQYDFGRIQGDITEINGVMVRIEFVNTAQPRWSREPSVIKSIRLSSYGDIPTSTYPRDKHGQFNVQKICERLDAVTRAVVAKREKDSNESARSDRNRKALREFCEKKYGNEYTQTDYKRGIELKSDSDGFTVTLTVRKRAGDIESLARSLEALEKVIDDHTTS